jgi:repressor LexA
MDPLTHRQTQILEFIRATISRQGCPPTVREIGVKFRIASTHGVRCHLQALDVHARDNETSCCEE